MQRMRLIAQLQDASRKLAISVIARYALGVVSVAAALGIALLLGAFPFTLFLLAIALTVWYGRMGAGFLAIGLSMLSLHYFFRPLIGISHLRYFTVFTSFALVISWLSASRRRAQQALQEARSELEVRVAERTAELRHTTADAVAAQERFRDLVNSVEGIVWEADAETLAFTFVSHQAERILGYPAEQWVQEASFWNDHLHPEDRNWAVRYRQEDTAQKGSRDVEYRMVAAAGQTI
jgi:PAS domain S-box-containing protein